MKSILFLGCGELGLNPIKWAKSIGFTIIGNDKNPAAPGLKLADIRLAFDSTDTRGLTAWAWSHRTDLNIQYCYCGSDFGLFTASVIHQTLGIDAAPPQAVLNGTDKGCMKALWRLNSLNCPISTETLTLEDLRQAAIHLGYPVVVKPLNSSGSQGITIVSDETGLDAAYASARATQSQGNLLCEQFISGSHHDINGLFSNGKFYRCGISDRFFMRGKYPVARYGYFPTRLSRDLKRKLYSLVESGARAAGIESGPVKADCVVSEGEPFIYEVSPRFHGDIVTSIAMESLANRNPIYQFFQLLYQANVDFTSFDDETSSYEVGAWRALLCEKDVNMLSHWSTKLLFNREARPRVTDNSQILGLAWGHFSNHTEAASQLQFE